MSPRHRRSSISGCARGTAGPHARQGRCTGGGSGRFAAPACWSHRAQRSCRARRDPRARAARRSARTGAGCGDSSTRHEYIEESWFRASPVEGFLSGSRVCCGTKTSTPEYTRRNEERRRHGWIDAAGGEHADGGGQGGDGVERGVMTATPCSLGAVRERCHPLRLTAVVVCLHAASVRPRRLGGREQAAPMEAGLEGEVEFEAARPDLVRPTSTCSLASHFLIQKNLKSPCGTGFQRSSE